MSMLVSGLWTSAYLELFDGSGTFVVVSGATFVVDVELLAPLPGVLLLPPLLPAFWVDTDDTPAVDDDALIGKETVHFG